MNEEAKRKANLEILSRTGLIVVGHGAYEQMWSVWASSDSGLAALRDDDDLAALLERGDRALRKAKLAHIPAGRVDNRRRLAG